jgi:glycosyltransferase involved in cell wall biosynthesis
MITAPPPPHISVIIPVYNGGENFRRCLDALAATGYANYEIVVVDDGSTDGSAGLAERNGCRVLHTSKPRSGPAVARNLGVQAAHGDVVFFVDADVAVRPETVGLVAGTFADDPGLAALFGSYDDAPGAPNFLSQVKNLFHHYVHQHSGEQAASFWSGCGAMRRDVFLRHGGFDTERYGRPCIEDIELGYRVTRSGLRIRLVKALQVKHLKRWTVLSLLRSDILDRGIPWTRLLLREKAFANDLNLQTHNRVSVATTWLLALCLVTGFILPWLWLIAAGAAGLLLALNWPVYRWFAGQRGWPFALAVIPWHWLYYFYNGVSFAAGLGAHLLDRRTVSSERSPVNQPIADASQSTDAESAGA